jgi:hypothetical protein
MKQPTLHGAVDGIMHAWCMQQRKERWGEKTPNHTHAWREVSSAFPEAQFVHLIRDARDVAASWLSAPFGPKHAYVAAKRWREYVLTMEEARRSLPASRFFEMRYERLIESPEVSLRQLCEYLREPYAPQMLHFNTDTTPYLTDERNTENLTRPLMRNNIYKWRRKMPKKEVVIIEAVAKTQLENAGYAVTNADAKVHPLTGFYYGFVVHPMLRARSMAANTKGQIEALKDLWAFSKSRLTSFRRRA